MDHGTLDRIEARALRATENACPCDDDEAMGAAQVLLDALELVTEVRRLKDGIHRHREEVHAQDVSSAQADDHLWALLDRTT